MTEYRTKKNSNIMNRLVSVLSEEDIIGLANYYYPKN